MILSSQPKPVNFRIVLNNAEITSIESLQKNFDFEKLLVNDRMPFLRWLKRIDNERGKQIEETFTQSGDQLSSNAVIKIMNIIYVPDPKLKDMVDVVNFLYDHDINNVKANFSKFMSMQGDKLQEFFPIDRVPQGMVNLDRFLSSLDVSLDTSIYLSRLHYQQGNIELSLRTYPPLWTLTERERGVMMDIMYRNQSTTVSSIITSQTLSLIGAEFIFLCVVGYMGIFPTNKYLKTLAKLIDSGPAFLALRNRIGGKLSKMVNADHRGFYLMCERLGYTKPQTKDPLLNEKLFLSSIFADDMQCKALLSGIKDNYFPALFVLDNNRCESKILLNRATVPFSWLNNILKYHENPSGLNGDYDKEKEDDEMDELVILAHQRSEFPSIMGEYFCDPNVLNQSQEKLYRRERIKKLQSGKSNYHTVHLKKREKEYLNLSKEVIYMCEHWSEYINNQTGEFTEQCNTLIEKYRKEGDPLQREKLFVVAILLLLKDHNKNRIYIDEEKIIKLKNTYIPMEALFRNNKLSVNDKLILKPFSELLHTDWRVYFSHHMDSFTYRCNHYTGILKRWIANIVYYI